MELLKTARVVSARWRSGSTSQSNPVPQCGPRYTTSSAWSSGWTEQSEFARDSAYLAARTDHALRIADRAGDHARIEGVLLLAEDNGQRLDLVAWLLSTPQPDKALPAQTPIPARPSCVGWRGALDLLTAIVAWGDWHPPAEPIEVSPEPTRAEVRQLRFGRTRRQEQAGALARVLVLDTRRRAPESAGTAKPTGSHAPPAAHLRRAHWHRYRHGSTDDWHYERHWIPPVLVKPTRDWSAATTRLSLCLHPKLLRRRKARRDSCPR